jgi:membrane-bound lytic murein transglycosylase B
MQAFAADMSVKHGYDAAAARELLGQARFRAPIIRAISTPGTARPWFEFRQRIVDAARIQAGLRFWAENSAPLDRASREFGVPQEIIVATIGIETLYGRNTGSFRVLDALTTLAFDYPPRADFFRSELEHFLLLTRDRQLDPLAIRGSYAGAIGIPQFMPSSYRKYAVDFDGDGRPDLMRSAADSIGSVANYYREFGWKTGAEVASPIESGAAELAPLLAAGTRPHTPVADLRKAGLAIPPGIDDAAEGAVFSVETEAGPRLWLALQNFYVITRYNRSINYAMAVNELAREIGAQMRAASGVEPQSR